MNLPRFKIMASALALGVQRLAIVGAFLVPAQLAADTTDNPQAFVDVWGSYDWIDTIGAGSDTLPADIIDVLGTGGSSPGGSGAGTTASPNDKDLSREAKPCAEIKIQQLTGTNTANLTQMMTQVPVNRSATGMNAATAQSVFGISAQAWANLGAGGQNFHQLQPAYTGTGGIYFPTDANGRPALLSDPQAYSYFQANLILPSGNPAGYGSYGPTWLGLVNALGMSTLAQAFAATGNGEGLAQEFFLQHEYAHGQTPGFPNHANIRDESSFFTASGTPATADGVALLNMAAIRANQLTGGTFTQELDKLKQLGINIPAASYPMDPNC